MIEVVGLGFDVPSRGGPGGQGASTLVDDVDVSFASGQVAALSGPSGSGKTTVLSLIGGLLRPTRGGVLLDGTPSWSGSGDPPASVSLILQIYGLVPILTARENVSVALRARGVRPSVSDEAAQDALDELLVGDLASRQVEELSGGQMQRVACARALVVQAPVLLADEPTSELDRGTRDLVMHLLRVRADAGATVVVATHDPDVAALCDVHHRMDEGRLVTLRAAPP